MMFESRSNGAPRQNNRRGINKRRKKSQHLLDVNIRSDKARSQRNQRIILFGCKILIFASVIVGVVYGVRFGLDRLFFANPTYVLNQIEVENEGTLPREQIIAAAKLKRGVNIFSVSLPEARQALLDIPQVEDAQIQRSLPDTLKISIRERHPVAWLAANREQAASLDHTTALMIDASGIVLKSRSILPEYLRLPVIAGVPTDNLRVGKKITSSDVLTSLSLIQKASDTLAGRFDIEWIDLGNGYSMEVRDRERTTARLSFDDLDSQLQRLRLLLDYCDANQQKMETVNLLVQKNVPVTFVRLDTVDLALPEKRFGPEAVPVRKAVPITTPNKKSKSTNGKG
ncbi:MAG TPA: FtsQ-type POTRA domain-containing protein [Chthoniobacterales bacterium]|jgi:cell division septal protein FtsQ